VRKNPLARAVRVGKLTFAALEATLTLFLDEETALREVPTLRMLQRTADDLAAQAKRIADAIKKKASGAHAELIDGFSQMGSGSLPTENIPTTLVAVTHPELSADEIASRLRHGSPPVFARIQHDRVLLDPRTLQDGDEAPLVEALASVLARVKA
jgi:L-seryl-tRNA(Ser) seleniumtransferase